MSEDIKRMDIKEFREQGFLQELNRQFLHPLGLALEIIIDDDGNETLGGVWDYRDDPEGMFYHNTVLETQAAWEKMSKVLEIYQEKAKYRMNNYGYVVQPLKGD